MDGINQKLLLALQSMVDEYIYVLETGDIRDSEKNGRYALESAMAVIAEATK
jgi:hypothetical protein